MDIFLSISRQDVFVAHVVELQLWEQIAHSADYMNVERLHIVEIVVVCHTFLTQSHLHHNRALRHDHSSFEDVLTLSIVLVDPERAHGSL